LQDRDDAEDTLFRGQEEQLEDPGREYVFAGQSVHVGCMFIWLIRLIILLEAVTISAAVSKVSQITTLEKAKLLYCV
jgi:hypothetical protein